MPLGREFQSLTVLGSHIDETLLIYRLLGMDDPAANNHPKKTTERF